MGGEKLRQSARVTGLEPCEEGRQSVRWQAGPGEQGDSTSVGRPLLVTAVGKVVEFTRLSRQGGQITAAQHERKQGSAADPADQLPEP